MGTIALIILLAVEVFFLVWTIISKSNHTQEKSIVRIAELALLSILLLTGVFEWGFRYFVILGVLAIQTVMGVIVLVKKAEKTYSLKKSIFSLIRNGFLYTFALIFAIVFPQSTQPIITGSYEIETAKYTWVDDSRIESFSDTGENRALTVEFWYPKNIAGKVPLVVFSHGAFGIISSNTSTYMELASNGYVVCSIAHTYHAMYTMDTDGNFTMANMSFMQEVSAINSEGSDTETNYSLFEKWMTLRTGDMNFVVDTILEHIESNSADEVYQHIDADKIGLMGHSMGGSTSTITGRERDDIDAVVNLEAPLFGDITGIENGKLIYSENAYPLPLLNLYSDDLWDYLLGYTGDENDFYYTNYLLLSDVSDDIHNVHIAGSKHLSLTDLPLLSPMLANILQGGKAEIDKIYCIETMNRLVLEFFDCYLKDGETPKFKKEY